MAKGAASASRAAVVKMFQAASEVAATAYVTYPHAQAWAQVWGDTSAVPGMLAEHGGAVLFEAVQHVRPGTVVEIGSYLGRSTVLLALSQRAAGVPSPRLVAIDPHTGDRQHLADLGIPELPSYDLFRHHVAAAGVSDIVEAVVASSGEVGRSWDEPIDLLYVDGWHSFDAVMEDGRLFLPHLRSEGVVIFDDYSRYAEVAAAVKGLDREGAFHFWGPAYGRAIGGRASEPSPGIKRMLRPERLRGQLLAALHR